MTNYEDSFKSGLEEARKADRARKEIKEVIDDFASQIRKLTNGKVGISIEQHEVENQNPLEFAIFKKRTFYNAITAVNPEAEESPQYKLARWNQGEAGYPCKVSWDDQERYCEDKKALQRCLAELISNPRSGECLLSLLSLENNEDTSGGTEET